MNHGRRPPQPSRLDPCVRIARPDRRRSGLLLPDGRFRVGCTKGTYVRTLAHDLGQRLGCGAHLVTLRRIVSGKFNLTNALPLEQVLALSRNELEQRVIPFLELVRDP